MIESIEIASTATFGQTPEKLTALKEFNFIFGANGTGKTTISRIIEDISKYPNCAINWENGTKLQTLVYNRDFVERNFSQSTEINGIFTLGEKNVEIIAQITLLKHELEKKINKIHGLQYILNGDDSTVGKRRELAELESEYTDKFWKQKQKHDDKFSYAFHGLRNNKDLFKDYIIYQFETNMEILDESDTLVNLQDKAETVFLSKLEHKELISLINADNLIAHESNIILSTIVIGKDDVDISAMIKKLGSSDWVRQGRYFYNINNNICPFCQQSTTERFTKSLNDYFDETFENNSKAIIDLETKYKQDAERIQQQVASIINNNMENNFIEIEQLKSEMQLLDSIIRNNIQLLSEKKNEPSKVIILQSVSNVVDQIKSIIENANSKINMNNMTFANIINERKQLAGKVWKYIIEKELNGDLKAYTSKKANIEKAITNIEVQIRQLEQEKKINEKDIRELEKLTASIDPTINDINELLISFGFDGFSITKADNDRNYKLVRIDGSDAKETLSEGEKTFITFLYFYHLINGSNTESGITDERVVVFDDPVSSLDSDILFIVSSLIKGLFEQVKNKNGYIKQIFILTHNVYFHKEITFNKKGKTGIQRVETFWIIHKYGKNERIEKFDFNPIKTSYGLLWEELKKPDLSNISIQNIMRRILENYFKILGGVDNDKLCDLFVGKEKFACNSLISWVNDGSHYALDDEYVMNTEMTVDVFRKIFKEIFEKSGNIAHYEMMMS